MDFGPNFFGITVLADVTPDTLVCKLETFGPMAALMSFDTEEQAIALANDTDLVPGWILFQP